MIKTSPKMMAILYFAMGILFTYFAIQTANETIWNFSTIALALIATLDFGVGIRLMSMHWQIKKSEKE